MHKKKEPPKDIELVKVHRDRENWDPIAQVNKFKFRAILTSEPNIIKSIMRKTKLEERLKREAGQENKDWIVKYSTQLADDDEIYFKNSMFLITWKMTDIEEYKTFFQKIEEHDDSLE
jgi:hypothetical protein